MMHAAYLSLGSNIDPEKNLYSAWQSLSQILTLLRSSSIWESPPHGTGGPNFLNAVLEVESNFELEPLKWEVLRNLEDRMGRVRTADKFAPRPIDLDILMFDGQVLDANLWMLAYLAAPCADLLPTLKNPESGQPLSRIAVSLAKEQNTVLRCRTFSELIGRQTA